MRKGYPRGSITMLSKARKRPDSVRKNDRFELPWDGKMGGNKVAPSSFREGVALGIKTMQEEVQEVQFHCTF